MYVAKDKELCERRSHGGLNTEVQKDPKANDRNVHMRGVSCDYCAAKTTTATRERERRGCVSVRGMCIYL